MFNTVSRAGRGTARHGPAQLVEATAHSNALFFLWIIPTPVQQRKDGVNVWVDGGGFWVFSKLKEHFNVYGCRHVARVLLPRKEGCREL